MARKQTADVGPSHVVLSCMDYRHMDDLERELRARFGRDDAYDHLILAGASLGVAQQQHPEWAATFWTHLDKAFALHPTLRHIWIVEHAECGAYRHFLAGDRDIPAEQEFELHRTMATLLARAVEAHPMIKRWKVKDVRTWIMHPHDDDRVSWYLDPLPRVR